MTCTAHSEHVMFSSYVIPGYKSLVQGFLHSYLRTVMDPVIFNAVIKKFRFALLS